MFIFYNLSFQQLDLANKILCNLAAVTADVRSCSVEENETDLVLSVILYKPLAVAAGWRMYPARRKEFAKLLENIIYLPAFGGFER